MCVCLCVCLSVCLSVSNCAGHNSTPIVSKLHHNVFSTSGIETIQFLDILLKGHGDTDQSKKKIIIYIKIVLLIQTGAKMFACQFCISSYTIHHMRKWLFYYFFILLTLIVIFVANQHVSLKYYKIQWTLS